MCGFTCIIDDEDASSKLNFLASKKKIYYHRGPDYIEFYRDKKITIIFKRLSIIDLTKKSNQPMFSKNRRYVIVFNGEIYNYLEIKNILLQKGVKFKSKGDTEVLLNAYIFWGEKFVNHLRGMFSFCIWDRKYSKMVAYRDRFGQKPLYYYKTKTGIIISSEIKDITQIVKVSTNEKVITKYILRNIMDNDKNTFYKNLYRVEPSHKLEYSKKKIILKKYFSLKYSEEKNFNKEEFLEVFQDCVNSHLNADVKVAFLLSGGLDSTSLASIASINKRDIKTFSVIPKHTYNEKPYIDSFINKKKLDHEYINVDNYLNSNNFLKVLQSQDEPFHSINCFYQYFLQQNIKNKGYKVLIIGEGGDEVMGGYDRMFLVYMTELWRRKEFSLIDKNLKFKKIDKNRYLEMIKSYDKKIKKNLTDFEDNTAWKYIKNNKFKSYYNLKWNNIGCDYSNNIFKKSLRNSIFSNDLQMSLRMSDRNAMAASIENRAPFLDHKFVEYIFSMKNKDFFLNFRSKGMLRKAMENISCQKIINRTDKTGRPGNDIYFVFFKIFDDFLELLSSSNLENYGLSKELIEHDLKMIKKKFINNSNDLIHKDLSKSVRNEINFFFRIYSFLIWKKFVNQ